MMLADHAAPICPKCREPQTVKTRETVLTEMYLCLNCRLIFTVTKSQEGRHDATREPSL
jgi:hypothetical protein